MLGKCLHLGGMGLHPRLNQGRVVTLRPHRSDFLAEAVAFGLQALKPGFYGTSPGIGRKNSLDDIVHSGPARGKASFHKIWLIAEKADIEHEGEPDMINRIYMMNKNASVVNYRSRILPIFL